MFRVLKALVIIILKNITLQRGLYSLAFLAFGIGDGITSAYMMSTQGPYSEANPVIRASFMIEGFGGMVLLKLWMTLIMLLAIYVKSYSNGYWTVNCVLFAIIAGGLMGIYSNMSVINGAVPPEPGGILLIYAAMVLIFIQIGSFIDTHITCEH